MTSDAVRLVLGDCVEVLPTLAAGSVDAVITSPPYAMQRAKQYGGVPEAQYPEWTVAWLDALRPAMKPQGSVLINIREHIRDGEMSDYVHKTRLAVRAAGWIECDELIWVKENGMPVGHPTRPRRSWERLLWFSLSRRPWHDAYANGKQSKRRRWSGDATEWCSDTSCKPDGGISRCSDVISLPNSTEITGHPATFPVSLAIWAIRLVCVPGGIVLDPFSGSGTTAVAAINTGRRCIAIEKDVGYFEIITERVARARNECGLFAVEKAGVE